jgi:D-alanyl-D-alanine carboxypeptidase
MKPVKKRRIGGFLKRHTVAFIAIPVAIIASIGLLYWYTTTTDAKIAKINNESTAQSAAIDIKIKEIIARKAAEEKARQEAAAKAAADQAQTADASTAATIDSSDCNTAKAHIDPSQIDVLVNKKHCIQPVTFVPDDLVSSRGATLSAKAIDSFNALMVAAISAGYPLTVTSSYRSYSNQVSTYAYWVGVSGKDGADTYSARPGYSEHQTGLAFDVAYNGCALDCFGTSAAFGWMQTNAAQFGFIQRYHAGYDLITGYKAEEWHYRYVGAPIAIDMQAKGIKTLEEYWNMPGGDYY